MITIPLISIFDIVYMKYENPNGIFTDMKVIFYRFYFKNCIEILVSEHFYSIELFKFYLFIYDSSSIK